MTIYIENTREECEMRSKNISWIGGGSSRKIKTRTHVPYYWNRRYATRKSLHKYASFLKYLRTRRL